MPDHYDLFFAMDEHISRPRFTAQRAKHFYPSEASVEVLDEHGDRVVHGGCLRASFFRLTGMSSLPEEARMQYIFEQGHHVESIITNLAKEMGIWVANSVKFIDLEHNISGELDLVLKEPSGQQYGGEVKSFYGYYAKSEIFGNRSKVGMPKMSQLLQTLIYCHVFQDRLPYFRMIYFARDSVDRKTFKIELAEMDGKLYPQIDGRILTTFTMDDIYERYARLSTAVQMQQAPAADFELQYSAEKINDFHAKGKVSKTAFAKFNAGKLKPDQYIGDWNCRYCKYKNACWGVTRAVAP